jgi:hypothetical protein
MMRMIDGRFGAETTVGINQRGGFLSRKECAQAFIALSHVCGGESLETVQRNALFLLGTLASIL